MANLVRSSRSRIPSFCRMLARCRSTVLALITRVSAISLEECPSAISLTISSSRGVRMLSGSRSSVLAALQVVPDQRGDGAGVEERLAAHRRPAGLDQVAVGDRLEHVAGGAGLERLEEVLLVVVHRQHQDAHRRRAPGDLPSRLQPGHPRHGDVQDGQVDVPAPGELDGLGAVAGLGDHHQVGLAVQDQPQPAAHQRVVVGQQDPGLVAGHVAIRVPIGTTQPHLGAAARPRVEARSRRSGWPARACPGSRRPRPRRCRPRPSSVMRSSTPARFAGRAPARRGTRRRAGRRWSGPPARSGRAPAPRPGSAAAAAGPASGSPAPRWPA